MESMRAIVKMSTQFYMVLFRSVITSPPAPLHPDTSGGEG